jgi:hypothetical protein
MHSKRFKNFASIMIAVVTVLGAAAACLGSVAINQAGNADFDGITAAINVQKATLANEVTAYEHYRAYTTYYRYNELGILLYDESLKPASDVERDYLLGNLQREVWGLALGLQYTFFPPRYLNPDGSYNIQRELDETWADAAAQADLNPEPYFLLADALRTKALLFTGVLITLGFAFWFFTAAEISEHLIKYLFAGIGLVLTVLSLGAGLTIEFFY